MIHLKALNDFRSKLTTAIRKIWKISKWIFLLSNGTFRLSRLLDISENNFLPDAEKPAKKTQYSEKKCRPFLFNSRMLTSLRSKSQVIVTWSWMKVPKIIFYSNSWLWVRRWNETFFTLSQSIARLCSLSCYQKPCHFSLYETFKNRTKEC